MKNLLLIFCCFFAFAANSQDSKCGVAGTWKFETASMRFISEGPDENVDQVPPEEQLETMRKSIRLILGSNGDVKMTTINKKQTITGTWKISADCKTLSLISKEEELIFKIVSLSDNKLVLFMSDPEEGGQMTMAFIK